MLKIILIMFSGIALGYLLRKVRWVAHVGTTSMVTILLLLFVMGIEIGGNDRIIDSLASLGVEALVVAVAATLGAVVAARIVYNMFLKNGVGGDEK